MYIELYRYENMDINICEFLRNHVMWHNEHIVTYGFVSNVFFYDGKCDSTIRSC